MYIAYTSNYHTKIPKQVNQLEFPKKCPFFDCRSQIYRSFNLSLILILSGRWIRSIQDSNLLSIINVT